MSYFIVDWKVDAKFLSIVQLVLGRFWQSDKIFIRVLLPIKKPWFKSNPHQCFSILFTVIRLTNLIETHKTLFVGFKSQSLIK